jgi:hypothetical protein
MSHVAPVESKPVPERCQTHNLQQELASMEKKARVARALTEEEEQKLLAERRQHDLLRAQVANSQLQLRPAP